MNGDGPGTVDPRRALVEAVRASRGRERVQFANAPRAVPADAHVDERYDERQIELERMSDAELEAIAAALPVRNCAEMAFHFNLRLRDPAADIEMAIGLDIPVYDAGVLPITSIGPTGQALPSGQHVHRPFAVFRGRAATLPRALRSYLQPAPRFHRLKRQA